MKRNNSGFTFIEIIIALGLSAILLPALGRALSFSLRIASQGEKFSQAYARAQQSMETLYAQKSQDWSSLADGTSTTSIPPFTRTVTIEPGKRNLSGDIDSGGLPNADTKYITIVVSWPEAGGPQNVTINSYVTNH